MENINIIKNGLQQNSRYITEDKQELLKQMSNLPIKFLPSKNNHAFILAICGIIFIMSFFGGHINFKGQYFLPSFIFVSILSLVALWNYNMMIGKGAYLIIDQNGFRFKQFFYENNIKWSDIEVIIGQETRHKKIIKWKIRKPNGLVAREEGLFEKLFKTGGSLHNFYPISNKGLGFIMEEMRKKYASY